MIKIRHVLFLSIFAFTISSAIFAQKKEQSNFELSGSVDAYYRANLNASNGADAVAPGSSFANLPGFALGMVNLKAAYEGEKVGFVADLVYGPRGEDAIFNSSALRPDGSSNIVNQLYMYWNVSDSFTVTFGNFNTFLGYEVISPVDNFNYSTSYLFSYGPFSHTGLRLDYTVSDDVSLMFAVMNPTDQTEYNPTGKYAFGAQIGFYDQYLNFLSDDGGFEVDYTGGVDLSDNVFLGVNAAYFDNDGTGFWGIALYPKYTASETFSIGVRGEYFKESGAFGAIGASVSDSSVFATTFTANYSIGDLTIIPEVRFDSGSDDFFLKDGMPKDQLSSFLLATVYKF